MRILIAVTMLMTFAGSAQAQAPSWCLKWNDGCKTCERKSVNEETQCTQATGGCVTRLIRCERADKDALQRSCEQVRYADSCNQCSGDPASGRQMCTLKMCPPGQRWVYCLRPRR